MSEGPWMLLCSPWSPASVSPGRFVIDEHSPQDNYGPSENAPTAPDVTVTDVDELTVLDIPSQDTKLSLNLSMFASRFFGRSRVQLTQLKACKARRYLLKNASTWLDTVTAAPTIQYWLEERLIRERCKHLWLITGTVTFEDVEVSIPSSTKTNAASNITMASLAETGLPDPLGLSEVGAGIEHSREKSNERSFKVPSEQVFDVQYTRVKLRRVKGEATKKAYLAGKSR